MLRLLPFLLLTSSAFASVSVVSLTPTSGTGTNQTFTILYGYNSGSSFSLLNAAIATTSPNSGSQQSCQVQYAPGTNTLWLLGDTSGYAGQGFLHATGTISNSHCTINLGSSNSVTIFGQRSLVLSVTFNTATYSGMKNVYAQCGDSVGNSTGWLLMGTYNVQNVSVPTAISVVPGSGYTVASAWQTFVYTVDNPSGASGIQSSMLVVLPPEGWSAPRCGVLYYQPRNVVMVINDAANAWLAEVPVGTGTTEGNSQCVIDTLHTTVAISGTHLTVSVPVMFYNSFVGTRQLLMYADNSLGLNTGWYTSPGNWVIMQSTTEFTPTVTTNFHYVYDDYSGDQVQVPTSPAAIARPIVSKTHRQVTLASGDKLNIPRADLIDIGTLAWEHSEATGQYTYTFSFDNGQVQMIRIGDNPQIPKNPTSVHPEGWTFGVSGWWDDYGKAAKASNSRFSITTDWQPGLVPLFFRSGDPSIEIPSNVKLKELDDTIIAAATSIFENSLRKFVIGPAFRPNMSRAQIMDEVRVWRDGYGFKFLAPLFEDGGTVADLVATTPLEAEIVQCLQAVIN